MDAMIDVQGFDGFEDFLKENGIDSLDDFGARADHEKIHIVRRFLTKGVPERTISQGDWRKAIEDILRILPADQLEDLYELDSLASSWNVVELPATVTGPVRDGFVSEYPLPHVHGLKHGVDAEYMTMGVVVARNIEGCPPGGLLVNVFQDWVGFSHCFCSIELASNGHDDGDFLFTCGTFHPGSAGLVNEKEVEFLGFLENFYSDISSKSNGDLLPGRWQRKRDDTRIYRPGVNQETGRAMLVDVSTNEAYQWDHLI